MSGGNRELVSQVPDNSASGLGLCQSCGILQRKCKLQWTPPRYHAGETIFERCLLFVKSQYFEFTQEHLFAENKEKLISAAILSLITKEGDQDNIPTGELEQQFHALRRLVASKAGYGCFTTLAGFREKVGWKVAKALKRNDDGISHASIDMLCALMEPMHQDYDLRQEQLNKSR